MENSAMRNIMEAYFAGIANEIALKNYAIEKFSNKTIKIISYYTVMIFLAPKFKSNSKNYTIVNGQSERRINNYDKSVSTPIYYAMVYNNIFEIKYLYTIFSEFTLYERLKIIVNSIISYFRIIEKEKYIKVGYWIESIFWASWIHRIKPNSIKTYGHFDRLTTVISYLSQIYKYEFIIQQHGLVPDEEVVKYKIFCNCLYAFNCIEGMKFKKYIIRNKDCVLKKKYISSVCFEAMQMKTLFSIGIIDQPYSEMLFLVEDIVKHFPDTPIVIMLHPRSHITYYASLQKNKNVYIFKKKKINNVDILITYNSTLFLDYIYNGYDKKIIITAPESNWKKYSQTYKNIKIASSHNDVINLIYVEKNHFESK